ncbi:MAG: beta strand repeat-containing protein, partial [Thermoanaerobaculia bacterium]
MRNRLRAVLSFTAAAIFATVLPVAAAPAASYGQLPLTFESNEGQADPEVHFLSRGRGYSLLLTSSEAELRLKSGTERAAVRWQVVGGNRNARITGESLLPSKTNYFIGNDPARWRAGVANYARVRYASVYPGIDLVYHGNQRQLEYDFIVAPNANPKQIRVAFDGIESMRIGSEGELILGTAHGNLVQPRPIVYQEANGRRRTVDGRYKLLPDGEVGFALGRYDRAKPLVIDPVLIYSTFFGGSGLDQGTAIAVDGSGNAYVAGYTDSASFPGSSGSAIQSANGGGTDAFVTKINAAGTAVVHSTYLGGNGDNEYAHGIAVDGSGNAYVTGVTSSTNFPGVTGSSLQSSFAGGNMDAFLTKINAAGSAIIYSTYLGGTADDGGQEVVVDGSGNAYLIGFTGSTSFPGVSGGSIQSANAGGGSDAFLTKVDATASSITYSTFLGGSGYDVPLDVAVDGSGNAHLTGYTDSTDFIGVNGGSLQSSNAGGSFDGFITKVNAAGSAITWSTYHGGSGSDFANAIALDNSGNVVVAGDTDSSSFPGVSGSSLQSSLAGGSDAFVTKINSGATSIVWSTYLGGNGSDYVAVGGAGLDSSNNVYLGGPTLSTTFNGVTGSSMQPSSGGNVDSWVAKLNAAGTSIGYATFLGGSANDNIFALTVDAGGDVYATGVTDSTSFPGVTGSSIQSSNAGGTYDGFIVKISELGPTLTSISPANGYPGTQVTLTGTNFGALEGSGSVWLGSKLAGSIVSWTNTQIVAVVDSGATSGSAIVQQNGVWSNSIAFTVIAPSLTSISPTSGYPGTQVTFTGTDFGASQGSGSVWLGSKAAGSIVSWSDTQVVATVAAGAASGNAQIQQNGVWSNTIAFTVPAPSLTSITPTSGVTGTQVTYTGTNFGSTQGSGSAWLGSKLAGSIVSWS